MDPFTLATIVVMLMAMKGYEMVDETIEERMILEGKMVLDLLDPSP